MSYTVKHVMGAKAILKQYPFLKIHIPVELRAAGCIEVGGYTIGPGFGKGCCWHEKYKNTKRIQVPYFGIAIAHPPFN